MKKKNDKKNLKKFQNFDEAIVEYRKIMEEHNASSYEIRNTCAHHMKKFSIYQSPEVEIFLELLPKWANNQTEAIVGLSSICTDFTFPDNIQKLYSDLKMVVIKKDKKKGIKKIIMQNDEILQDEQWAIYKALNS